MADATGPQALRRRGAALLLALAVAACGGGGGSPAAPPATPPPPATVPPSPPPPAGQRIPPNFALSFPEGPLAGNNTVQSRFSFYAPSQPAPLSAELIGTDAAYFEVTLSIATTTDRNGYREAVLEVKALREFDFETPEDADRNNFYSFGMSLVYPEGTLGSVITISITDIKENGEAGSVTIEGEAINQMFGAPITRIPDITGDGKEEIGVSVLSNRGPASAYVVSSEFYTSIAEGKLSIAALGTRGTRFRQSPTAPANEITFRNGRPNLLTAEKRTSGGVDLLLSDAERRKIYLFELSTPADYAALRGDIDPASIASAIVYSVDPAGRSLEARLIGDVNGDGRNDIFVQEVDVPPDQATTYGIIFGRAASTPADRARSANAFDIQFNAITPKASAISTNEIPRLLVQTISDITGDGAPELVIAPTSYGILTAGVSRRTSWLVKSPILRGATPRTVSLLAPSADPVTFLQNLTPNAIAEIADQDGDGFKTLVIATGGYEEGLKLIDGDALNAAPQTFDMTAAGVTARKISTGLMAQVGDLDGDGAGDFIINSQEFGIVARHGFLAGAQTVLPTPDPAVPGSEYFRFVGLPHAAIAGDGSPPLYLSGTDQIAFGFTSQLQWVPENQTIALSAGHIVIVKQEDIRKSIAATDILKGAAGALKIH